MKPAGVRIGIFGGAFDPVHLGHVKIAESFLASNIIDKLLVLPTPASPHKKDKEQTPFGHRYEMLKLVFQEYDKVFVSDLESHLPKPSYTLRTIETLQEKHPENKYFLCIGEDSLAAFNTWWKYEEILLRTPLIVASRPGSESSTISREILERAIFIDHTEVDVSSTEIRKKARMEDDSLKSLVPESVAHYIFNNKLYSD